MIRGDRIAALLAKKGWSNGDLARRIGTSTQAVWKLVNGNSNSSRHLLQIARELDCSPEYLLGETDDPKRNRTADTRLPLRGLGEDHDPDLVRIEEIDLRYGLGATYLDVPVASEVRHFSRSWLRQFTTAAPDKLFWTAGDGDSMEPTIRSGELILIDRSQTTPRMGDGIWAVAYGDVGMIKRLRPLPDGRVEILSDNTIIPPVIAADGELHIIGRVIAVVRRL